MQRADSLEKTLMLGKIEGKRRRGWQRMRWLASITDSMDMNLSKPQEIREDRTGEPGILQSKGSQRVGRDSVTEQPLQRDISRFATLGRLQTDMAHGRLPAWWVSDFHWLPSVPFPGVVERALPLLPVV